MCTTVNCADKRRRSDEYATHRARTNNILESYHSGLRRRIQVSHSNFFNFLTHLQNVTVDNMVHLQRLKRGVEIRRPKKREIFRMTPASRHASHDIMLELTTNCSFCAP